MIDKEKLKSEIQSLKDHTIDDYLYSNCQIITCNETGFTSFSDKDLENAKKEFNLILSEILSEI